MGIAREWLERFNEWSWPVTIEPIRVGIDIDGVIAATGRRSPPWESMDRWEKCRLLDAEGLARAMHKTETNTWETYAVTAGPAGRGRTMQQQTRRWLERHGAGALSVVVEPGNRAAVVRALMLDWLIDDTLRQLHCDGAGTDARVIWVAADPTDEDLRKAGHARCEHAESLDHAVSIITPTQPPRY